MLELNNLRVCLVEPSAVQAQIMGRLFAELGIHPLETVGNGADALARLKAGNLPDLVVSALYLPDMTGTDLVYRLREDEALAALPFALVSSETRPACLDPVRQAGALAILPKPFDLNQLTRALQSTLGYLNLEQNALAGGDADPADLELLLVDDSPTARRHIRGVLEKLGFERISEAHDGAEAIRLLEHKLFDLVITDYNMPDVDGLALTDYIRRQSMQSSVPVMMVSSEHDESRLAAVVDAGVSAICDKPFDTDTVRGLLAQCLANR